MPPANQLLRGRRPFPVSGRSAGRRARYRRLRRPGGGPGSARNGAPRPDRRFPRNRALGSSGQKCRAMPHRRWRRFRRTEARRCCPICLQTMSNLRYHPRFDHTGEALRLSHAEAGEWRVPTGGPARRMEPGGASGRRVPRSAIDARSHGWPRRASWPLRRVRRVARVWDGGSRHPGSRSQRWFVRRY